MEAAAVPAAIALVARQVRPEPGAILAALAGTALVGQNRLVAVAVRALVELALMVRTARLLEDRAGRAAQIILVPVLAEMEIIALSAIV